MATTRCYKQTIRERAQRDPEFVKSLLKEVELLSQNGEPEIAELILRDLINPTRPKVGESNNAP